DEVCVDASRGAFGQVEPEAELAQELKLPLDEKGGPRRGIVERAQHVQRRAIELGMRVSLRQEPRQPGKRGDRGKRRGVVEHERGMSLHELDIEPAEMLCDARPPSSAQQNS